MVDNDCRSLKTIFMSKGENIGENKVLVLVWALLRKVYHS